MTDVTSFGMTVAARLRRVVRSAPFAVAQRLVSEDTADLIRCKLFPMNRHEARRVLAALVAAAVPVVLAGGWGVDALVGEQRRRHADLDVIAPPDSLPLVVSTLAELGYQQSVEGSEGGWWAPDKIVFRHAAGGSIDLLLLTVAQWEPLVRRAEMILGGPVDRAPVLGDVGGLAVPCLSAPLQLAACDGYAMNRDQRSDRRLLDRLARGSDREGRP